ncbi:CapA family protein [Paenibacillus zeisoli]|uniref:CapA family protein n=2 Tax=Paenibacillus zeisoli TaxID=2496267 RepID=A0A3S1BX96_9BACL|nr:CapA family protein [Paenibacillus zeisoli]
MFLLLCCCTGGTSATDSNNIRQSATNSCCMRERTFIPPLPGSSTVNLPTIHVPVITRATLAAVGDVLIHSPVYKDAAISKGRYNFNPMFDEIRKLTQEPDILVANQESMIGGSELGLSSYPSFNSPHEIGDALKMAGVDMVTLANNHTMDRGEKAIRSALAYWDKLHMPYTGSFRSEEDAGTLRTLTSNNITFAFLAYTYGTNGIAVPKDKPYLVNLINLDKIKADVEKAKKLSDVIVVSMHWGTEYEPMPNREQQQLAQQLADMGVQIVIGNHPHVLQPPAWVQGKNGNKTFVMYSLGNFLSAQEKTERLIGGIGSIEVIKTVTGVSKTITLKHPSFIPTYNYYRNHRNFKIIPMSTMTSSDRLKNAAQQLEKTKKHMSAFIPDLAFR